MNYELVEAEGRYFLRKEIEVTALLSPYYSLLEKIPAHRQWVYEQKFSAICRRGFCIFRSDGNTEVSVDFQELILAMKKSLTSP